MTAETRPSAARPPFEGWLSLLAFLAVCYAVAAIGGWVTVESLRSWYPALVKPPFNPPNAVFGPVWTVLYGMIAVAGWRLWRRREAAGAALAMWSVQLGLNAGWSCFFFGLHDPALALLDVGAMLLAIAATMALAWRTDRTSSLILAPYLAWVAFAAALNFEILRLN